MAKISLNYGTKDAIEKETITDGAVYLSTDTDELFVDLSGLRHIIGSGPAWTEMEQPPGYTVPTISTTDSSVDLDQATGTYTAKLNFSNVAGEPYSVSQMNTINAGKVTVNDQAVNAVQSVTKTDNAVNVVFNAGEVTPTESGTATLAVASGFKVNDDTMTDQAISFVVPCERPAPIGKFNIDWENSFLIGSTDSNAGGIEGALKLHLYGKQNGISTFGTSGFGGTIVSNLGPSATNNVSTITQPEVNSLYLERYFNNDYEYRHTVNLGVLANNLHSSGFSRYGYIKQLNDVTLGPVYVDNQTLDLKCSPIDSIQQVYLGMPSQWILQENDIGVQTPAALRNSFNWSDYEKASYLHQIVARSGVLASVELSDPLELISKTAYTSQNDTIIDLKVRHKPTNTEGKIISRITNNGAGKRYTIVNTIAEDLKSLGFSFPVILNTRINGVF